MRGFDILTWLDPTSCGIGFVSIKGCAGSKVVEIYLFYPLLDKHGRQNEISVVSQLYVFWTQ